MATIPDFIGALRSYLLADVDTSALVGTRVFAPILPESEAASQPRRAVVISGSGGGAVLNGGYGHWGDHRVDIRSYGENDYQADRVHRAVYGALKQMRRNTQGDATLFWARPEQTGISLRDPDTEWPFVLTSWQVLVGEVATP